MGLTGLAMFVSHGALYLMVKTNRSTIEEQNDN